MHSQIGGAVCSRDGPGFDKLLADDSRVLVYPGGRLVEMWIVGVTGWISAAEYAGLQIQDYIPRMRFL